MVKDILYEYDSDGNLSYIVDIQTSKGYRVNNVNNSNFKVIEQEIFDYITNERIKNTKTLNRTADVINKIINFKKELSVEKVKIFLLSLYFLLIPINVWLFIHYSIFNNVFFINSDVLLNTNAFVKGILMFVVGIIFIHEGSHILIARMFNIRIEKIGFKFKYYAMPIFFVRVYPTSYTKKKMNIAFVGLVADLLLLMTYLSLYVTFESPTLLIALNFQLLLAIFNYNIFLPTDFTQSVLNYFGKSNLRNEILSYVKEAFKGNIKVVLKELGIIKLGFYFVYTLLFSLVWLFMLINLANMFISLLR
ncbi:MAG: hypothetical protein ABS903_10635 [Solibacillus sp.]